MGNSFDWYHDNGFIAINKRNVAKVGANASPVTATNQPAQWTSKYGSLTVNQFGLEFPIGGINEKGLAIEIMWLDSSVYPKDDTRPFVNELQWIQYQLDNFQTLDEVIQNADSIRVKDVAAPVHYMVCDAGQKCGTFEYLNGKLVIHSGTTLPIPVLTNDTYDSSYASLSQYSGFGGTSAIPTGTDSLERFARAASLTMKEQTASVDGAFDILTSVAQGDFSKFNVVYDFANDEFHFRTHQMPAIRSVQFNQFDFSCKSANKVLDIEKSLSGDVTKDFTDFTAALNNSNIEAGLAGIPLPDGVTTLLENYPSTTKCME